MKGRFRRGLATAKHSFAVLKAERSLAFFPVIAGIACLLAGVLLVGGGAVLIAEVSTAAGIVVWAVAIYVLTFIGIYCNAALAAAAAQAIDGRRVTVRDGFAAVRGRRGVIAQWALVQVTVGLLLQVVYELVSDSPIGRVIASIFTAVASAAWSVATFFVLPILALEGLGPKAAVKRSAQVVKARWGEGLVGTGAIGAVMFFALLLPLVAIIAGVMIAIDDGDPTGVAMAVVGLALAIPILITFTTLQAIFRVVLFRFATEDRVVAGFGREELEDAFRRKRRRAGVI
jgi:hypothetical protein